MTMAAVGRTRAAPLYPPRDDALRRRDRRREGRFRRSGGPSLVSSGDAVAIVVVGPEEDDARDIVPDATARDRDDDGDDRRVKEAIASSASWKRKPVSVSYFGNGNRFPFPILEADS